MQSINVGLNSTPNAFKLKDEEWNVNKYGKSTNKVSMKEYTKDGPWMAEILSRMVVGDRVEVYLPPEKIQHGEGLIVMNVFPGEMMFQRFDLLSIEGRKVPTERPYPNVPNKEGRIFLEENHAREGVLTLPSGLQYKVLRRGTGLYHPKEKSSCECRYAGTTLAL